MSLLSIDDNEHCLTFKCQCQFGLWYQSTMTFPHKEIGNRKIQASNLIFFGFLCFRQKYLHFHFVKSSCFSLWPTAARREHLVYSKDFLCVCDRFVWSFSYIYVIFVRLGSFTTYVSGARMRQRTRRTSRGSAAPSALLDTFSQKTR